VRVLHSLAPDACLPMVSALEHNTEKKKKYVENNDRNKNQKWKKNVYLFLQVDCSLFFVFFPHHRKVHLLAISDISNRTLLGMQAQQQQSQSEQMRWSSQVSKEAENFHGRM
jgi:hypothetical protein